MSGKRDALMTAMQEAFVFLETGLRLCTQNDQIDALRVLSGALDDALDVLEPVDA